MQTSNPLASQPGNFRRSKLANQLDRQILLFRLIIFRFQNVHVTVPFRLFPLARTKRHGSLPGYYAHYPQFVPVGCYSAYGLHVPWGCRASAGAVSLLTLRCNCVLFINIWPVTGLKPLHYCLNIKISKRRKSLQLICFRLRCYLEKHKLINFLVDK